MSRRPSQRRTDSQKRALERCKSKGKANNVIDIDTDKSPNFIIIDVPETSEGNSPDTSISGKDKVHAYRNVICIADDDFESGHCGCSLDGFEGGGSQNAYFTSSKGCLLSCNRGRKLSSKSSLYHQKFSSSISLEDDDSEDDDSDCDIVEDNQGNIRQLWEEASLRKKMFENAPKRQSVFWDEMGPAGININSQTNVDMDKTAEVPTPCSTYGNHESGNFNPSARIDEDAGGTSNKSNGKNQHADLEETIWSEMCKRSPVRSTQVEKETTFKLLANTQLQVEDNPLLFISNRDDPADVQNYIIGDREMLKKTEAYKLAQEEEWTSRQRELKSQAEEAQRLRKRRKAETLRLLETERRQKQRVEEVREAQKKDEETLNLKEQLRIEVRRELDKLEANCRDMASLLRGLGINTGGGLYPLSSESKKLDSRKKRGGGG
ncbi:uncharacterized protein LOC110659335 isoform X2 [Hevea brasiliensis]|uniref:uncharacterized protein LOC110659335 isoform X2 n=1 Tax=Hevea brasiliensis TaxID=3981 RepID=UPI0025CFD902|nr:uncharacterized protein LOC110659335 isoform X2 [Hevea brasiliensis]XP_057995595.1 uncharacterized protein LOC110659335 isoform X2 [Hevea brasiliensis]